MAPALKRERAKLSGGSVGRGRPPKRIFIPPTERGPARVADEPLMALAFYLRRMDGARWVDAAFDTATEFGLSGERMETRVERAARTWRVVCHTFLIEHFPADKDRLNELLREPSR